MKHKRAIRTWMMILFSGLFLLSAYMVCSYFVESRTQEAAFTELEKRISAAETSHAPELTMDHDSKEWATPAMLPGYAALYEVNHDLFGWVQIADTKLNYPVMYTPDDPEYYLCRAFDRSESASGVPFLDGDCSEDSGNYLIHGHNMNAGTMFASLLSYAKQDFYEEHPVIRFDTLYERGAYEVIAAFYAKVYDVDEENVFRYYQYTDLSNPERFQEYVEQGKAAALYDTGITAEYGDQLLTLSTCSCHTDNGRFVVIARKEAQDQDEYQERCNGLVQQDEEA